MICIVLFHFLLLDISNPCLIMIGLILEFPEMTVTDDYDYFLSCVESLSPVFFEVEEHLLSKHQEDIWMKHKIYLEWIPEAHLSVSACIRAVLTRPWTSGSR